MPSAFCMVNVILRSVKQCELLLLHFDYNLSSFGMSTDNEGQLRTTRDFCV